MQHKIRLAGIDAPESSQDFGTHAKQNLSSLVHGKYVIVVGDKIDRYGRRVGKVVVNGVDANLAQVRAGYAWHYKQYQDEQTAADRAAYSAAEREARAAGAITSIRTGTRHTWTGASAIECRTRHPIG